MITISELAAAGTTGRDQKIPAGRVGQEAKRRGIAPRSLAEAKRGEPLRYPLRVKRPSHRSERRVEAPMRRRWHGDLPDGQLPSYFPSAAQLRRGCKAEELQG